MRLLLAFIGVILTLNPGNAWASSENQTRDICYVQRDQTPSSLTSLDLYLPTPGDQPAPVMIMVHGGGWESGDKADANVTMNQVPWFTNQGWLYISINYRLAPEAKYNQMARDVAAAIHWVRKNIHKYDGDPDKINIMGYEAGAHLAALATLNEDYFLQEGVSGTKPIKSLSLYNGLAFDVEAVMGSTVNTDLQRQIKQAIGDNSESQLAASPSMYINSSERSMFPFLTQFVPQNVDAKAQTSILKARLRDSNWVVRTWASDETDATIISDVGTFNEPVTQVQLDFLRAVQGAWVYTKEVQMGAPDVNGNVIQATETDHIIRHQDKLYAGLGNWDDRALLRMPLPITDSINSLPVGGFYGYYGAIVLVKESAGAPWKVDHYFGTSSMRVDVMSELELTTDKFGNPLSEPFKILYTGVIETHKAYVYTNWKDPYTGEWGRFLLDTDSDVPAGCAGAGSYVWAPYVRQYWTAVNSITGVHEAFAGAATGKIYRGVYDPAAPGYILWDTIPEIDIDSTGSPCGRPMTALNINGQNLVGLAGKVFKRDDAMSRWTEVLNPPSTELRAFSAIPAADGNGVEFLTGNVNEVLRIDNRTEPMTYVTELDLNTLLKEKYGPGSISSFCAYNHFTPYIDPGTGHLQQYSGTWTIHPYCYKRAPWNGTFLLIRDQETRQCELSLIYDYEDAPQASSSGSSLRGARFFVKSPFSEHEGRVFYTGGFDAAINGQRDRNLFRNTAWLYRAEWSKDIGY
jgi:arylformamidase